MRDKRLWGMAVLALMLGFAATAHAQPNDIAVITVIVDPNGEAAGSWEARLKLWDVTGAGVAPTSLGLMDFTVFEIAGINGGAVTGSQNVAPNTPCEVIWPDATETHAGFSLVRGDGVVAAGATAGIIGVQPVPYNPGTWDDGNNVIALDDTIVLGVGTTGGPWTDPCGTIADFDADSRIATGTHDQIGSLSITTSGKLAFSVLANQDGDPNWEGPENNMQPQVKAVVTQVMRGQDGDPVGYSGNNGAAGGYDRQTAVTVEEGTYNVLGNMGVAAAGGFPSPTPAEAYVNLVVAGRDMTYAKLDSDQDLLSLTIDYSAAGTQGLDVNSPGVSTEYNGVRLYGGADAPARHAMELDLLAAVKHAIANGEDGIFDSNLHINSALGVTDQLLDPKGDPMVLLRATINGDATCDGTVTLADVNLVAANWGTPPGSGLTWDEGDVSYDGGVTLADVNLLAANWAKSYAPEPATLMMLGLGAVGILYRKRNRK